MPLIRRMSFRLSLAIVAMISTDLLVLSTQDLFNYRRSFLDAVIAVSLIFAITTGIIMAIINNYVKGLREQFMEQARRVRTLAWDCRDYFAGIDDKEFQTFFSQFIRPLAEKSLREWSQIENIQNWEKGIDEQLLKLMKMNNPPPGLYTLIYRYLLPLEDEISQLGLLYIRRAAATVHVNTATGSYYLLCFAVGVIAFGKIMPSTLTINLAALNGAAAVVTYAVLELLFVLSFLVQEVSEEYIEITNPINVDEQIEDINSTNEKT
ncbi:MAG: hypothetical protein AB1610_00605 [Nitrospirota bacterium]